ncbi:hypothetical protein QBC36DRAFT_333522 [Triangularia setosa]|uniref:Uncharacterized protein n=1 Tax=Triangularia setosa TaxID=2587417 RepID=A0AAN6W3K3_9PEZI|nr:hypothetical protein QBC36DRAFT_333522 [Podospora setosa]
MGSESVATRTWLKETNNARFDGFLRPKTVTGANCKVTTMPSIPLKAQIAIRDQWQKKDGALQTTIKTLEELLGHEVDVEPEWHLLIAELDSYYPDKGNLVTIVTECVQVWARSMIELLDDSEHEAWGEQLLEMVPSRLRLFVAVADSDKGATSWSEQRRGFIVSLPKKQIFQPAELFPIFCGNLLICFNTDKKKTELPIRDAQATVTPTDDWAEVEVNVDSSKPLSKVEFLPNAASLPRPDQLFLRPPYYLTMTASTKRIEMHCSHSPTLQFLSDYLQRWCRVNRHDTTNPPAVQITLHQSAFGLGEMFNLLVLSTEHTRYTNEFQVTAPMVAALIEGVLGYKLLPAQGGWSFRRDVEFKML